MTILSTFGRRYTEMYLLVLVLYVSYIYISAEVCVMGVWGAREYVKRGGKCFRD